MEQSYLMGARKATSMKEGGGAGGGLCFLQILVF